MQITEGSQHSPHFIINTMGTPEPLTIFDSIISSTSKRVVIEDSEYADNAWVGSLQLHFYRTYERRNRFRHKVRRVVAGKTPRLPVLPIEHSTKRMVQRAYDIREESYPLMPYDFVDYERGKRFIVGRIIKQVLTNAMNNGFEVFFWGMYPNQETINNPQQGIMRCNRFELSIAFVRAKQKPHKPLDWGVEEGDWFNKRWDMVGQPKLFYTTFCFAYVATLHMSDQLGFPVADPEIIALPDGRMKTRWVGNGGTMTSITHLDNRYNSPTIEWETFVNFNDGTKRRLKHDYEMEGDITFDELLKLKLKRA